MEHLLPWLVLKGIPGVGNHLFKKLYDRFGSPEHVFAAPRKDLLTVEGMSPRIFRLLHNPHRNESASRELDRIAGSNFSIVTMADARYPPLLLQIPDPPPFLYVYGRIPETSLNLAVVGSRHATGYGMTATDRLCGDLVTHGLVIVSGMARGIDTAAHTGAIRGGGRTVAVLGSGVDRIYPAENRDLYHRIAQNGAVVSELPLSSEPEAYHFPARNRIISGMSLGTVIVEATLRSGSLITARLAADQGREVYAVPGSIRSFKSTGTHTLIKQGAKLVENALDILEELPPGTEEVDKRAENTLREELPSLTPEELNVARALEPYPVHIDRLIENTGLESGQLAGLLLQLELKNIASQSPGKMFCLSEKLDPSLLDSLVE